MKIKITILILIICTMILNVNLTAQSDSAFQNISEWEAFPILNYDSDVGFGYGGKGFLYNFLSGKESFDLILYNSTKGERWYRFVFSMTDMQRRQGKKYPLAIDVIADYDKLTNYKYYSSYYDKSQQKQIDETLTFKREIIELTAWLNKGMAKDLVLQLGVRYKSSSSFDLDSLAQAFLFTPSTHLMYSSTVKVFSLLLNFRLDTRDNYINPQTGFVMELQSELARDMLNPPDQNYGKIGFLTQSYLNLFVPNLVFANRILLQAISEVNFQFLLPIGGNSTLRGLPQDRYLNSSATLINSELRFPIWWKFGGVAGVDIGNGNALPDWIFNPVTGLRFYMDNFVVRFDVGFGKETTGVYFNFGHMF